MWADLRFRVSITDLAIGLGLVLLLTLVWKLSLNTTLAHSITLTSFQMDQADRVARRLHDRLRRLGVKNAHGLRDRDATPEMEANAAAAELAAALLLDVPWTASLLNDPCGPDIGSRTQVRSSNRPRNHHSLIVRPRDIEKYNDVPFVLVIQRGCHFTIKGWMMAFEATKEGRLWNGGDRQRPDAWFVGEEKLHDITTLSWV